MDGLATESLLEALPRFLRRCDAESTRQAYERELLRFLAWLEGSPGNEVLFDYRDHLRDKGLKPTTVRWRTTVVRAFLAWAAEHGYLRTDVVGDFRPPRGTTGFAPRVLSARELQRLLRAPDRRSRRGRRDVAVLVCLGVGGLRAGEACRLDYDDLQLEAQRIVLRVTGKGRKQRLVSLPEKHVGAFRAYLSSWPECQGEGAPLFRCGQPGREERRLTVAAVDYLVRTRAAAAGLPPVGPHALRHTAASLAIEGGAPIHRLRDRLGHSSALTTSLYLHTSPDG